MWKKYLEKNFDTIKETLQKRLGILWYKELPDIIHVYEEVSNTLIYNNRNEISVLIYIPFCKWKCNYCPYYSEYKIENFWSHRYTNLLIQELELFLKKNPNITYTLSSLYVVWWTPSLLEWEDLYKIISKIKASFLINQNTEMGIEVVASDISKNKAKFIAKCGFDIVQLGVQSFNEKKVNKTNRVQNNQEIYNAVTFLRNAWIKNITFDLIIWLSKKETLEEFIQDNVEHINQLQPNSITIFNIQSKSTRKDYNLQELNNIVEKNINIHAKPHCKYLYDRRYYLKNVLWLWYKAYWQYWENGVFKTVHGIYKNIYNYEEAINNNKPNYHIKYHDNLLIIKKYIIRHLYEWINLKVLFSALSPIPQKDIYEQLNKLKAYTYQQHETLYLNIDKIDFINIWTSKEEKYFCFCFLFLYSEAEKEKFQYNINILKK